MIEKAKAVFSVEHLSLNQLFMLEAFMVIMAMLGLFCLGIVIIHPAH